MSQEDRQRKSTIYFPVPAVYGLIIRISSLSQLMSVSRVSVGFSNSSYNIKQNEGGSQHTEGPGSTRRLLRMRLRDSSNYTAFARN